VSEVPPMTAPDGAINPVAAVSCAAIGGTTDGSTLAWRIECAFGSLAGQAG